jgi:ubiquinone/menaquinone biosynthesis C-methylase UbiE
MTEIVGGYFDYDASDVHLRYAQARRISPRLMTMWLDAIGREIPRLDVKVILGLGCGTGRFTAALGRHFCARVIGLDPSGNMLRVAAADAAGGSAYVQASAGRMPLCDGCADLVFASMVWHHFSDKREAAAEIARVLRTGGYLCIRTTTFEALDSELYLHFFPSARSLNERIMPARHDLISCLTGCGLALTHHSVVRHPQNRNPLEYAERVGLRAFSDLASIPDREFRLGMEALRRHCAAAPQDQEIAVDVDLFVFRAAQ